MVKLKAVLIPVREEGIRLDKDQRDYLKLSVGDFVNVHVNGHYKGSFRISKQLKELTHMGYVLADSNNFQEVVEVTLDV